MLKSCRQLRNLYVASDVYLSASKAEGLGIPILEAMACGLPVVGCDTGAITELLADNRGFLISSAFDFYDVWGNELRRMIDIQEAYEVLDAISESSFGAVEALEYVKGRTFDIPVAQMIKKVEELTGG